LDEARQTTLDSLHSDLFRRRRPGPCGCQLGTPDVVNGFFISTCVHPLLKNPPKKVTPYLFSHDFLIALRQYVGLFYY